MPYTQLRYHLIIATKSRRPWLTSDVEDIVYPAFARTFERLDCTLFRAGGIEDHVHFVCSIPPKLAVSHVAGRLKCESTRLVKSRRDDLDEFEWGGNFSAFTLNPFDLSEIIAYVENQKEHHKNDELRDELEQLPTPPTVRTKQPPGVR